MNSERSWADFLAHERAFAKRLRRLGPNPRCRECGWTTFAALQPDKRGVICYDCANLAHGKPIFELHHPRGHAYPEFVVNVRGNEHRLFHDPLFGAQAWLDYLSRQSQARTLWRTHEPF